MAHVLWRWAILLRLPFAIHAPWPQIFKLLGLAIATVMRRFVTARVSAVARTVLFLPQVVPLVAAGIAWFLWSHLRGRKR